MSDSEEEQMDYTRPIRFSDSEAAELIEVSEKMEKLFHENCTWRVTNTVRKELRDPYPLPRVPATRTPQLDQRFHQ